MIRVMVVDDQELIRRGLAVALGTTEDITLVEEAGDGAEALDLARRFALDVVVMDIRMPRVDGIAAIRGLQQLARPPKALALTTFDLDDYAVQAIRAGAGGFLLKDAPGEDLLAAIRNVHADRAVLAPATTKRLLARLTAPGWPPAEADTALDGLTRRERDVFLGIARGEGNVEIAERLFVSESTVKAHVRQILSKLRLRDRIHVVIYAYERGIVVPGRD